MVVRRKKKVVKYRGHTTHGGGSRKKRRGAGSRGGRGNAGTGKRAGHKKAGIKNRISDKTNKGFISRGRCLHKIKVLNIRDLTISFVEKLVADKKASKEGGAYVFDLEKLGYKKLLGMGSTNLKLKLNVAGCSPKAAEKIKAAGGEVQRKAASSKVNESPEKEEREKR